MADYSMMEDDHDDCPPEENLSQDCVIEWEEEQTTGDLRDFLKTPPAPAGSGTTDSQDDWQGVRRRLVTNSAEEDPDAEINAIFNQVEQSMPPGTMNSSHATTTQRIDNRSSSLATLVRKRQERYRRQRPAGMAPDNKDPANKSRRSKRSRMMNSSGIGAASMTTFGSSAHRNQHLPEVCTPPPGRNGCDSSTTTGQDSGSAFAELLKQVTTPQRDESPVVGALVERTTPEFPTSSHQQNKMSPAALALTSKFPPPSNVIGPPPAASSHVASLQSYHVQSKPVGNPYMKRQDTIPSLERKEDVVGASESKPMRTTSMQQPVKTNYPNVGAHRSSSRSKENLPRTSANQQPSGHHIHKSVSTHAQRTADLLTFKSNTPAPVVQHQKQPACSKPKPPPEDEFDCFDISEEDLAKLDSMLAGSSIITNPLNGKAPATDYPLPATIRSNEAIRSDEDRVRRDIPRPNQSQQTKSYAIPSSSQSQLTSQRSARVSLSPQQQTIHPNAVSATSTAAALPTAPTVSPVINQGDTSFDEFDDFPDVDFEALEKTAMAQHKEAHTSSALKTSPLIETLVRNQRAVTDSAAVTTFSKFSRYKVLSVVLNSSFYSKTLSVAEWSDGMVRDDEKERGFQRNCEVTVEKNDADPSVRCDVLPRNLNHEVCGEIQLRGEWYHTQIEPGDVIHIVSQSGKWKTDVSALPIVLHTFPPDGSDDDDLLMVVHPDILMIPTTISESVGCSRRAVLKARVGSNGLMSQPALVGTLRHELFGVCIQEQMFDVAFARRMTKKIVREKAESLVGCGLSEVEAESEVLSVLPVIREFVNKYTTFNRPPSNGREPPTSVVDGLQAHSSIRFVGHSVHSIEEPVISPELALKGNLDAVLETSTTPVAVGCTSLEEPENTLTTLELKTGHNQKPVSAHVLQLALYTMMLQLRYGSKSSCNSMRVKSSSSDGKPDPDGASKGGALLYLNAKGFSMTNVSLSKREMKTLIGNRNNVATDTVRSTRPRGVALVYEEDGPAKKKGVTRVKLYPAPPPTLPDVKNHDHDCQRCYTNRECMLYAASSETSLPQSSLQRSHLTLLTKFTSQLESIDFEYFNKWDRLIDLEDHSSHRHIATSWLIDAKTRQQTSGDSVSALIFENGSPGDRGPYAILNFRATHEESLQNSTLRKGSSVVISTDGTIFDEAQKGPVWEYQSTQQTRKKFRHQMHVVRGIVNAIHDNLLQLSAKREDLERLRKMTSKYRRLCEDNADGYLLFRADKDNSSVGIGTLRQNLINLFTADYKRKESEVVSPGMGAKLRNLHRLRDRVVRLRPPSYRNVKAEVFFKGRSDIPIPGCDLKVLHEEFLTLNEDQRKAVEKVMNAHDYTLIQGLPGTGKTSTLSFLARLLAAKGKRVLISAYTHSAVDNVVLKLMEKGLAERDPGGLSKLVRVGHNSSCHPDVKPVLASQLAFDQETIRSSSTTSATENPETLTLTSPSESSLHRIMSNARIVCCSALTLPRSQILVQEHFDIVIVDEAGQINQAAVLGPLMAADTFVLVGDHKQLPPLANSDIAEAGGFGESLLKRLAEAHSVAISPLTYQYRMNLQICKVSSEAFYGGKLKCGNDHVANRRLSLVANNHDEPAPQEHDSWIHRAMNPKKPVIFIDTDNTMVSCDPCQKTGQSSVSEIPFQELETKSGSNGTGNVTNPTEVKIIERLAISLTEAGIKPSSIGIITPFRAQVAILDENNTLLEMKSEGLEIDTIDRFQGRDKEVILLSFVRSNAAGKTGRLLQDARRLNVALTRAKSKMLLVGSFHTLKKGSDPLRPILGRMSIREQRLSLHGLA